MTLDKGHVMVDCFHSAEMCANVQTGARSEAA